MEIKEGIELKPWLFKIRGTNRRKLYTIIKRKDETFWCNCPSFKYNGENCKHINIVRAMIE